MIRTLASYDFRSGGRDLALLDNGWGATIDRGTWLTSRIGHVDLPAVAAATDLALEITLDPQWQYGLARTQTCAIAVNGNDIASRTIRGHLRWTVGIPAGLAGPIRLAITAEGAADEQRVLLSSVVVVQARAIEIPPPSVALTEIRFGWNETGNDWLQDGWGRPEDEYVWAIGGLSVLRVPVPPDGEPLMVLLDMRPHIQPPGTHTQRIEVQTEGCPPVRVELRERLVNAFLVRPKAEHTETTIIFRNLDAGFESADPIFHFGKPFAWALSVARIMPALPRFFPGARPPVPGSLADGTMRASVIALLGMPVADIADRFINLGNCCEFANLQRAEGCDRASLLRLSAIPQQPAVEGLFSGFRQIGRLEDLSCSNSDVVHPHWRVLDRMYGISFATPFVAGEPFPDGELHRQSRRLPRLAEKLIEDLTAAERIFVFRLPSPGAGEPAILAVQAAIRCFGTAQLLWLVNDGAKPPGFVERLACGVIRGHVDPPGQASVIPPQTIVSVIANALVLIRQAQPLKA